MIAGAALVPVAKRFPFISIAPRTKNIALSREDKIWLDGKREIGESGFEQIDGAAGVDRPDRTGPLQFANQFHALRVENWLANAGHECAIEIDAEEFDCRMHLSTKLGIDFRHAMHRLHSGGKIRNEIGLRTGNGTAEKRVAVALAH